MPKSPELVASEVSGNMHSDLKLEQSNQLKCDGKCHGTCRGPK